ncbi:MAG: hypothetical protein NC924_04870 [Candidatus Omnitrophica bacterium]|nr:hypothetical protein [Candidatus Omnitrophota bacterium]
MLEIVEKLILAGVGLANMTKEKADKLADTLISKGQLQAKDKNAAVSKILDATRKVDKQLEEKMRDIALGVMKGTEKVMSGTEKQIDQLHKKIAKLSADLEAERKKTKRAATGGKRASKK